MSSGWLIANVLCHPDDIRSFPMSSGWHNVSWSLCHTDEIAPSRISSWWLMTNAGCHPDDLWCCLMSSGWDNANLIPKSSGWFSYSQYLIRMTYRRYIMSSGWLTWRWYLIRMIYGKFIMSSGWHTLPFYVIGWLNWGWFLIRMSFGKVIMSSGWDTLPFLSHPDEIANFELSHHAVALQRFRRDQRHAGLCLDRRPCTSSCRDVAKAQPWVPLISTMHGQPFLMAFITAWIGADILGINLTPNRYNVQPLFASAMTSQSH